MFLPQMKHGLNTDQDRSQKIGKEEEAAAADENGGQQLFATTKTRTKQEVRSRYALSFRYLTLFFFALFAVLIRVQSVFHPWL